MAMLTELLTLLFYVGHGVGGGHGDHRMQLPGFPRQNGLLPAITCRNWKNIVSSGRTHALCFA